MTDKTPAGDTQRTIGGIIDHLCSHDRVEAICEVESGLDADDPLADVTVTFQFDQFKDYTEDN